MGPAQSKPLDLVVAADAENRSVTVGGSARVGMMDPANFEKVKLAVAKIPDLKKRGKVKTMLKVFEATDFRAIKGSLNAIVLHMPSEVKSQPAVKTLIAQVNNPDVAGGLTSDVCEEFTCNADEGEGAGTVWIYTRFAKVNDQKYICGVYYLWTDAAMDMEQVLGAMIKDGCVVRGDGKDSGKLYLSGPN